MNSANQRTKSLERELHAAFLTGNNCGYVEKIFDEPRRARIAHSAQLCPAVLTPKNFAEYRKVAAETEILFTCWGLPVELLTPEYFPSLKALFHSGGTVKYFARPLLERGVSVVSARSANATAVAQFCLAQIILSCKGYFRNTRMCRDAATMHAGRCFTGPGLYGEKISLLGMGAVARELAKLLRPLGLELLAVDPYLNADEAVDLGVKVVSMETAFSAGYVVSNHLPNLPELQRVLDERLFHSMRRDATFINTGRGAQVNEMDLIEVARQRPDLMFLLDLTYPEPPLSGSPLYELPNVQLSSHFAGATNNDVHRLGDLVIEEFERYIKGLPLLYAESLEVLDRLA